MKRFTSRYEKVRHLRAQQEEVCRAAAAARNAERATVEKRRDEALQRLTTVENEAGAGMSLGITGALLHSISSQIEQSKHLLHYESECLKKAEERLRQALEEHKQARAELKIVEEMIQKEKTEHRHEQLRIEEHQLQEQAAQSFYRKRDLTQGIES